MSYSEVVRNKIIYSIKNELDECKNNGKDVRYDLYCHDNDIGCNLNICIKSRIIFNIELEKSGLLNIRYRIFFTDNTIINNLLVTYCDTELAEELMKEFQYVIWNFNMSEDYSTLAHTFLKRLTKLELEYMEDNSDDIDKDIPKKKGDDK